MNPKFLALLGALVVLVGALVWQWVSGWGLITMNYIDAPLSKVIKSMERQGGVQIVTNGDPNTPISIQLERAPLYDAVDTLAEQLDGNVRLAYLAAPDKKQITDIVEAFIAGTNPGNWTVFSTGFGGGGPMSVSDTMVDPRQIEWKVSDSPEKNIQSIFQQGSQKTGALFATPKDWNPVLGKLPAPAKTGKVAFSLVKTAKGNVSELFVITVRPPQAADREERNERDGPRTVFSPQRGGGPRNMNPAWIAERAQAEIAALPENERAEAQKQFDEMRKFWETVRSLPEEERRAKIEEMMSNPEVQARIEERMASRDAKRTPAQRERRMKRYVERKEQIKNKQ